VAGALAAVAIAIGAVAWVTAPEDDPPRLIIGESVAGDFAGLAEATFDRFASAAPALRSCIGTIRLEAADELGDLARYDPATQVIRVRVPATAPSLEQSLVHEFAHHVERVCTSHIDLRAEFLEAQGQPPATEWFADVSWVDRPSEQFAEAVVEVVLGSRSRNQLQLRLTPEAIGLVAAWIETDG
jgi:hypothetical protein